jgi:hypothetical protein
MLTRLRVKNFKSWADTGELRLAPLTGLFGPNSSGKTSILQALLMLKQTSESQDPKRVLHFGDDRSYVDLGTYYDTVRGHVTGRALAFSFSWCLEKPLEIPDPESQSKPLYRVEAPTFAATVREESGQPFVQHFAYSFGTHQFGMELKPANGGKGKRNYDLIHGDYPVRRVPGRRWPLPPPVRLYGFPSEAVGYYQNTGFLPTFALSFEELFARMAYLGPLRDYPKRSYVWAGERPVDVGRRGELAIPALLAAEADRLTSGRGKGKGRRYAPIQQRIAEWLKECEMIHSFSLKSLAENRKDYELRVRKSQSSTEVLITDVGFGVSQLLPVLVLCYYVPEGSIILLEQPEIYLHPSVQANLADVFIDVVKERRVQIILESHSEHLLRRLQRRIAEKSLASDRTALYFCQMENGMSRAETLHLDLFGNISNWPQGFFGDELGELAAMTKAQMEGTKGEGK